MIHTEDKGVDTHMTLADILNYANVSLDEPWELEKDDKDRSPLLRTTGVDIQMQVFVHARRWGVGNDRGRRQALARCCCATGITCSCAA